MRTLRAPAAALALALCLTGCADAATSDGDTRAAAVDPEETSPVEAPSASPSPTPAVADAAVADFEDGPIGGFKLWRAMDTVRDLAGGKGIGIRAKATDNERRAARYIARKFESYGYEVKIQKFSVDGGISRNVIAKWPGQVRHPLVIGGHMDTFPGAPGANDNASGLATILEIARLAAGNQQMRYIRWVAFGSEEKGTDGTHHDGSEAYVKRMGPEGRERSPGALSVDMVADGKPLLTGSFGIGPRILGRMIYGRITRNSKIAMKYETLCDCTDNGPFEHAGIPGAFMYSGREPDYHSATDTPPNLRPKHLKRTGRALLVFVRRVDGETIRRLRRH